MLLKKNVILVSGKQSEQNILAVRRRIPTASVYINYFYQILCGIVLGAGIVIGVNRVSVFYSLMWLCYARVVSKGLFYAYEIRKNESSGI